MKRHLFFVLLLIYSISSCQTLKSIEIDYLVSYPTSKKSNKNSEKIYRLLINNDVSYYIPEEKFKSDSIRNAMKQAGQLSLGASGASIFSMFESVIYNSTTNKITTYKHILKNPIGYEEEAFKNWTLVDKIKKVQNYDLHLAEVEFGGRKWLAWYSTDYAINEGPFKFKNLPGLIFELYDTENIFHYQLIKIKNIANPFLKDYSKFKIVSKNKYKEAVQTAIDNPMPGLFEYMDVESQIDLRRRSRKIHKNLYYPEKEFE